VSFCRLNAERQSGELCDTEAFRVTCADGEVIVMTSARYGRMKLGRCVEQELGYLGCWRDVRPIMDRRCSGRRTCEVRVPDAELEATEPCLRELKNYMEASYLCVPGRKFINLI
jgi:Galactose binding lectin domain